MVFAPSEAHLSSNQNTHTFLCLEMCVRVQRLCEKHLVMKDVPLRSGPLTVVPALPPERLPSSSLLPPSEFEAESSLVVPDNASKTTGRSYISVP